MTKGRILMCAVSIGAIVAAVSVRPAFAQSGQATAGGENEGIEEIIVTAQKREQSLQTVPISVSALTAEALERNRVTSVRDLSGLTPNLQVKTIAGGQGAPVFIMRGSVGLGTAPGQDKGTAVYLDGVFLGSAGGQIFDVADIERIEVLRGPQGTLFGRNSSAGAISIVTRDPAGEFQAKIMSSIGNQDQLRLQARVDTPRFGPFSLAGTYTHIENRGDIRNLGGGTTWDFSRVAGPRYARLVSPDWLGGRNSESVAIALKGEITPDFTTTYKFDYTSAKLTTDGIGILATNFAGSFGAALGGAFQTLYNNAPNTTQVSLRRPDAVNNAFTVPTWSRVQGHNLTSTWQLSDSISIKNVFGYRKTDVKAPGNQVDGLGGLTATPAFLGVLYGAVSQPTRDQLIAANSGAPLLGIVFTAEYEQRQASDELQVNYDSQLVTVTAGLMYYWQRTRLGGFGTAADTISLTPAPNFVIPNANRVPSVAGTRSYAGYSQAEFHVTPELDLVGGIRVTHDKKYGVDRAVGTNPVPYTFKDTRLTYLLGLNYEVAPSKMLYAKYSTGYISGGRLGFVYKPETSESWEAGLKADWLDRRLRTNLAGFFVTYKNLQAINSGRLFAATRPDLATAMGVVANVGNAEAYGFELETTYRPVDPLTLIANMGYTHFKYTSLRPEFLAVGSVGPVYRPKWSGNFAAQYDSAPVFGDARLQFRVDARFVSDQALLSVVPPFRPQTYVDAAHTGDVWIFDTRLSLVDVDAGTAKVQVSAWGKNIFNNRRPSYGADLAAVMTTRYEQAATYGIDLTVRY